MLPAILVIFEVNTLCGLLISTLNHDFFFQIFLQFLQGFQATSNSRKIYMHIAGYPVQCRDSLHFFREKICSVRPYCPNIYIFCAPRWNNATSRSGKASTNHHTLYRWCYWPFLLCHSFS